MSKGEKRAERLFRFVCLSAALLLLVFGLFRQISLVRLEEGNAALEAAIRAAEDEGRTLTIRLESSPTLEELERAALSRLGMQHPAQGQLREIAYTG